MTASRDGTKSGPTPTRVAPFSSLFASKLNTQALLSGGFPTLSVLARGRVELQRVKKLRQTMNAICNVTAKKLAQPRKHIIMENC